MKDTGTTSTAISWGSTENMDGHRRQLKLQQEAMLRGETPPPIEPTETPDPRSCTQEPIRHSGSQRLSSGIHPELRIPSGSQEHTREKARGVIPPPEPAGRAPAMSRAPQGTQDLRVERNGRAMQPPAGANEPATPEMPLSEYIQFAAAKNQEALEYAEGWQGGAFTFTRYMKSHPDLAGHSSQEVGDLLDGILAKMFPQADDPWVELLGDTDSQGNACDPFEHFAHSWDAIRYPLGEAPLEQAIRLADEHPVVLPGHRSRRWEPYRRFIAICRWLQFACDGENFFLPVRKFGEILDVPIMTISNYRKRAERDGYLVLVKEHEGRKATEYRFNLDAIRRQQPEASSATEDWGEIE
ncbi:MAG: hypothetical protein HC897_02905 [Thermoanaerobaculia bacterium]|nr:hypothetical protein [Thermoanaerobaculia bacterium]